MTSLRGVCVGVAVFGFTVQAGLSARCEDLTHGEAREALRRALRFYGTQVAAEGGFLWEYSSDLTEREGENKASATQVWVQSPGTPAVGEAFLEGWLQCGEPALRDAAIAAGHALVKGQLVSGGWDYRIDFDPEQRSRWQYRVDAAAGGKPSPKAANTTTLDDDTTQLALRFLMKLDIALEQQDAAIHGAVGYALDALLSAQYANGAWPQRYDAFPAADAYPPKQASYPETWSRTWPKLNYKGYCTFNDDTLADMIVTMYLAAGLYGDDRYAAAARRAGDFILMAQMPEPQPAWAQQYDEQMNPAWARKFEPPAVTGGETQGVIQILLSLYRFTGDERYLEPIPRALDWLERSQLPDGQVARFYELMTNRPLYFTRTYDLTYDDGDLPTHYGFKVRCNVDRLRELLTKNRESGRYRDPQWTTRRSKPRLTADLAKRAEVIVRALDERGAWVESGRLNSEGNDPRERPILSMGTHNQNLATLCRFLAASQPAP